MYSFFLGIWYYFVGKPPVVSYVEPIYVKPENLKFGLLDDGENLYQYFIEETVYFFWGDFLEGRIGRQIETYLERILVQTRWNQVETGFEILVNNIDWVWQHDFFYTWNQDWGDEMILAVETPMAFDYVTNIFMWTLAFFYVFYIIWSNYFTFSFTVSHQGFFDTFHQTQDQYFDYYQYYLKDSFNIFEDGMCIVPSWFMSEYDAMSTHDFEFEDHEYMDFADMCHHPSEESDRVLDVMFDARGYVHYELFESLMDSTMTNRYAHVEDRLESEDIINGFEGTSLISGFWWDDYDAAAHTYNTFEQYVWQFKESRERSTHPYFFYHPLEHYNGNVDPWIMGELTWDYEPWLEDNFNVVVMGDILVEEVVFSFIVADGAVEEMVDEIEEENDYDYMDFEGVPLEDNELDQLVFMPLFREYELIPLFDDFGNKVNRTWAPALDWAVDFGKDFEVCDWEDWDELFDEGSDGMYSDNDAVLEDAYLVTVMSNDVYFSNLNHDVYGGALPFNDINEDLSDVYTDYSSEFFFRDLLESFSPYGRNEEQLYTNMESLADDYSFVPVDRLFRHVSVWEYASSIDYMMGEFLLDVSAYSREMLGLLATSAYQLEIIFNGIEDLRYGKNPPEYPIRWNSNSLFYEVYNVETHSWVNLEEAVRYLVLDLELTYKNWKYLLGYSPELLLTWGDFKVERSLSFSFVLFTNWIFFKGFKEYFFIFILPLYIIIYGCVEIVEGLFSGLYSFLKDSLKYSSVDLLLANVKSFISGEFYSNYCGVDLLIYDKDYKNFLFKTRCALRLDLETIPTEDDYYPSWWVRQGIFDQDFYFLQLNSFDPRNPLTWWYDRAEVMTYPNSELFGCGNLDMLEILAPEFLASGRKDNPYLAVGFALDVKYYDYVILAGLYERDPSQWLTDTVLLEDIPYLPFYFDGLYERRRQLLSLYLKNGGVNPFFF